MRLIHPITHNKFSALSVKALGLLAVALFAMLMCTSASKKMMNALDTRQGVERDAWLKLRSGQLKITPEQARERDVKISEEKPPEVDETLGQESARLWRDQCSACHGLSGDLADAPQFTPPPRKFGTMGMSMGFLFGGNKMRAGIYRTIKNGKGQNMPAYGEKLAREQIWGLVKFIEGL